MAEPVIVNVDIDVPAMLSIDEEEPDAEDVEVLVMTGGNELAEGIATVLRSRSAVPVVAVANGLIVIELSKIAQISATELMTAAFGVSIDTIVTLGSPGYRGLLTVIVR